MEQALITATPRMVLIAVVRIFFFIVVSSLGESVRFPTVKGRTMKKG